MRVVEFSIFQQELRWGEVPERAVRPLVVVDPHPCIGGRTGLVEALEGEEVEHLLTEGPVEPFDVPVLVGLALLDEQQFGPLPAPVPQRLCDELRAVVHPELLWPAPPFGQFVQFPDHPLAGQAGVDGDRQCLPVEIVDDVEGTERPALQEAVVHEVHRPGEVVVQRLHQGFPYPQGEAFLVLPAQVQPHLGVDAVDALVVVPEVQGAQTVVHHPEAPTTVHVGHLPQLRADRLVVFWPGFVANDRGRGAHQSAGLAKAGPMALTSMGDRLPLLAGP